MVGTRLLSVVLLGLMALPFAGCFGGGNSADPAPPASADDGDDLGDEDDGSGANDTAMTPVPTEMTLYFTASRGLTMELPSAGSVDQGIFLDDYAQGKFAVDDYSWLSEPLGMPMMVVHGTVTMTLWIESDQPIAPAGSAGVVVVAFFGSSKGMPIWKVQEAAPGPFLPGTPTKFDLTVDFGPPGVPIAIPSGEAFKFFGGLSAATTDQTQARILVGDDHASAVTFTHVMLLEDPLANATTPESITAIGTFAGPNAPPQESAFAVGPDATFVEVTIRPTSGEQALDLDLDLLNAAGEIVSNSRTPANVESMYLAGPALDGIRDTDVKVRVSQLNNAAQAAYEITFTQG